MSSLAWPWQYWLGYKTLNQTNKQSLTFKMPRKPTSENAICLCCLLNSLANFSNLFLHTSKQCGPWSDYFWESSLIWVHTVCKNDFENHKQMTKQTTVVVIGSLRLISVAVEPSRMSLLNSHFSDLVLVYWIGTCLQQPPLNIGHVFAFLRVSVLEWLHCIYPYAKYIAVDDQYPI